MDAETARKLKAAGKIAWGSAQVVGGVATGFGFGALSLLTGNHKMSNGTSAIARYSITKGQKDFDDGMREFNG